MIGPQEDIPAPDMATDEQTMAWMMDTYSMQVGHATPEIVTGKPISVGGSVFRNEATGAGVVMVIDRACHRLGLELAGQRCIVQGFGKVGGVAASELAEQRRDRDRDRRLLRAGLQRTRARPRGAPGVGRRERLDRGVRRRRPPDERRGARAALRRAGAGGPRGSGDGGERRRGSRREWSRRARTGRRRWKPTRCSPTGAFRCCPTSSRTRAASPSRTSSGCRTSGGCSGAATRSARRLADKMCDAFDRVWELSERKGLTLRSAALVAGIREVAAALEARGLFP